MHALKQALAILALSSVLGATLFAQADRGSVTGTITDASGAIVPAAAITITNEETGVAAKETSNSAGQYTFPNLNPGRYTVSVSIAGFQTFRTEHVQVDVSSRIETDAKLQPGATAEVIEVRSDSQQLNTTTSTLGMVVEQKAITDLPLIYGNPYALEFLATGITLSGVNPNIHVYDSGTATVSVNGSALNALDYKLDGAPDNRIRFSAFTPSTEFIAQYKIDTANYDASQGHSSGGFVNTSLKSGTNRLHGSLFGYYQNPKINGNTWALQPTNSKPTFVREGAGVGGPFFRDKAFWFAGFEHSRQGTPNVQVLSVPTDAERNGDFSAALGLDPAASGAQKCTTATTLTKPNIYQIFDPFTASKSTAGSTHYNRSCVPGNIIPASRLNPIAKNLFALYPEPNIAGTGDQNNFGYSASEPDVYNAEVARVDYTLTPKQTIYAHAVFSERKQSKNDWFGPVSGTLLDYKNRGAVLGYTNALTSSLIFSGVASYTRFTNVVTVGDLGTLTPTSIGLPAYLTSGLPTAANSLPRVDLTNYTSVTTATGTQAEDDIWLGSAAFSKQTGSIFTRFGVEYRRYLTNGMTSSGEQGAYVSNGSLASANDQAKIPSGIAFSLAALEFGTLSSGTQTQNSDFAVRSDYYAAYVQNDWKATPKLTVNLGLRWEIELPDAERNNKQAVAFNFGATNAVTAAGAANYAAITGKSALLPAAINPTGGFIFSNTNGYGKNPYAAPVNDFSPRIGFAYSLDNNTVIRAGYGIFFDSLNSYYLSGGNSGSTTTFVVPQQGYSSVSNIAAPTYTTATGINYTSTLSNPFPTGLVPVSGNSLGTSTALGQNIQFLQPNPHTPYNQRWSLGVQRQIGPFIASVDYVGNHGVHQPVGQISQGTNTGGREYNNIPVQYLSSVTNAYDQTNNTLESTNVTNPFNKLIPAGAANNLATSQVALSQLQHPYPEYASINAFTTDGGSNYNSLQALLQRRFSSGLSFTTAFTWSRSLDATTFLNPTDPSPWYGTSANDRPLRFAVSGIYELPFGRGRRFLGSSRGIVAQAVGGWQLQGVYQIQSGAPLTFTRNDIYNGFNAGDSHWNRGDYKNSIDAASGRGLWFNTANWINNGQFTPAANRIQTCANTTVALCPNVLPSAYQIRTMPLRFNTLRSDNLNQADVGVQRQFQVFELGTFQIRAEAVNVLNHPVYAAPNTDPTNTLFAQITAQANQPRVFQFAGFFRF